jgi:hypothetical protein
MLDAYLMSKMELDNYKKTVNCSDIQNSVSRFSNKDWAFLGIEKWMREPTEEYLKQLKVAQLTFGKAVMLLPWLLIPLFFIAFVLLYVYWSQLVGLLFSSIPVYLIVIALLPLVINRIAPDLLKLLPFLEALRPTAMLAKAVGKVMLLTMGTVFVQLYLWIINPLFLKYGRLSNLK